MVNYGYLLQSLGRLNDAIKCYEEALKGFLAVLGPDAREVHIAREHIKRAERGMQ
jgi:cob(I)alamin adenosyltransferase